MDCDDLRGATDDFVAVLGFSQGAKIAASLMLRQQVRSRELGSYASHTAFKFAVLLNGCGPLVSLDPQLLMNSALVDAAQIGSDMPPSMEELRDKEHVLRLPTIHVHGLQDPGLTLHQRLLTDYCDHSARLVEWEGQHRVPIKTKNVAPLVDEPLRVMKQTTVVY
jgi:hypothetical protein